MPTADPRRGSRTLIVPAAGLGSRLRSSLPKLLVPVGGRAMVDRLFDLYRDRVARVVLVVHPAFEARVRAHCAKLPIDVALAVQPEPTGMLDAILLARPAVVAASERVWITWCDQVAVRPETIARLTDEERTAPDAALIMPTVSRPAPYIHLQRGPDGRIARVLHRREGDPMPPTGESDMGLFSLSRDAYCNRLVEFAATPETGAATGERNFLPFIPWIAARAAVVTYPAVEEIEAVGVNTPEELATIERHLAARGPGPQR